MECISFRYITGSLVLHWYENCIKLEEISIVSLILGVEAHSNLKNFQPSVESFLEHDQEWFTWTSSVSP